jgi:hypothetical protein
LDTVGLGEPQLGADSYLAAIEKAYQLIQSLIEAGGLHLLLFCMRGDRMTKTKTSNYQFFYEFLCQKQVPVALVFTGLERETVMEDWWKRNKSTIENFGIHSVGHACITAVRDDTPGHAEKYAESEEVTRELLVNCALEGGGFRMDRDSWLAVMGGATMRLIPGGTIPKQNDIVKVLTKRCGLDLETARKVAKLMRECGGAGGADVIARIVAGTLTGAGVGAGIGAGIGAGVGLGVGAGPGALAGAVVGAVAGAMAGVVTGTVGRGKG